MKDYSEQMDAEVINGVKSFNPYVMIEDKEAVKAYFLSDSHMNEYEFFELTKGIAETGDPTGQLIYGVCLSVGLGCEENHHEAMKWWTLAGNQGDSDAQYNLGNYYYNDIYKSNDYKEAVYWLGKSAQQGHQPAQALLGECYFLGKGVPKDLEKAFSWYKKSVDNGNTDEYVVAQLGLCYYRGLGTRKNYKKAFELLLKGAKGNVVDAMFIVGMCYANGQGIKADMKTAVDWWVKAADHGHSTAAKLLKEIQV